MRHRLRSKSAFQTDERGVSAIEFALTMPVLIVLMFAGIQAVLYVNATRRVELIATSISQMLSQAVPQSNSTTASVNATDLHFAYDATLVLFPYLMKDAARLNIPWPWDISINYAGIQFQKIPLATCPTTGDQSSCYLAMVGWTSTGTYGGQYRPCVVPQLATDDTATPTRTALPRSIFGPSSIIAVDVVFNFRPTFGSRLIPPITIRRSIFVQPRYASYITYNSANSDGIATLCPGFS